MNILLTIKGVLNYLYNHLIELINVKKIVFQDGTEQTTAGGNGGGASLFDIKVMSQAIAEKGFAFMCHINRRDLAKADVPTLYNFILDKYNSSDVVPQSLQALNGDGTICYNCAGFSNGYLYVVKDDNGNNLFRLYRTNINDINSPVWELMSNEDLIFTINGEYNFVITDKLIAVMGRYYDGDLDTNVNKLKVFKLDGTLLHTETFIAGDDVPNYALSLVEEDNGDKYIYVSSGTNHLYKLYKFANEYTINLEFIANTPTYITDIMRANGYYFFIYDNRNDNALYRTTDWSTLEFLRGSIGGSFAIIGQTIRTEQGSWSSGISFDNGDTWQDLEWHFDRHGRFRKFNGIEQYICSTFDGSANTLYTTVDLINFTIIATNVSVAENFNFNEDNSYMLCMNGYDFLFSGVVKNEYTDTYKINGNDVEIKYFKCDDFKICLSDNGGTNDTNLETVFNYLGYLNYWLLDNINEFVSIQRDKNTYAMMYIGDNFEDDLEDLAVNKYAPITLKNENFFAITQYAVNSLVSGTKNTSYGRTTKPTLVIFGEVPGSWNSDWNFYLKVSVDNSNWIDIAYWKVGSGDPSSSPMYCTVIGKGLYWKFTCSKSSYTLKFAPLY